MTSESERDEAHILEKFRESELQLGKYGMLGQLKMC